ncbi:MAG: radical SAM protein, partial [Planctomycetota bacterium]|nr:radical SAM protein [Planctomycetota bacterium]
MMPKERYIELDVTYRCSAKCRHCCFVSSPTKDGVMPVEDARTYISEARKLGLTGRQITITGGEALLYYETVLGIVQAAAELEMTPLYAIQSNASWCTTDELTRERLTALRDAGLSGMFFSADVFHREFIPAERTRRGVRIADEIFGSENVAVPREFLVRDEVPTVDEHLQSIRQAPAIMVGRAPWEMPEHLDTNPLEEILEENCTGGRRDLDPRSVFQINVDPWGW